MSQTATDIPSSQRDCDILATQFYDEHALLVASRLQTSTPPLANDSNSGAAHACKQVLALAECAAYIACSLTRHIAEGEADVEIPLARMLEDLRDSSRQAIVALDVAAMMVSDENALAPAGTRSGSPRSPSPDLAGEPASQLCAPTTAQPPCSTTQTADMASPGSPSRALAAPSPELPALRRASLYDVATKEYQSTSPQAFVYDMIYRSTLVDDLTPRLTAALIPPLRDAVREEVQKAMAGALSRGIMRRQSGEPAGPAHPAKKRKPDQ